MSNFRRNDQVIVISGEDKGKSGKILKVLRDVDRVIVERVNFLKEFVRADRSKQKQGGIMDREAPIQVANVMLFCSDCDRPVRVKSKVLGDKSKIRVCARCENVIEKQK